jgi:rhodanese-related sulfurtransferase
MIPEVAADEAIALVAQGTPLIDVREQYEWDAGHSPDARLLPMSELQARVDELPRDSRILVICHTGARSARVTDWLVQEGFDAANVVGGMVDWQLAGGDVESEGPDAPRV